MAGATEWRASVPVQVSLPRMFPLAQLERASWLAPLPVSNFAEKRWPAGECCLAGCQQPWPARFVLLPRSCLPWSSRLRSFASLAAVLGSRAMVLYLQAFQSLSLTSPARSKGSVRSGFRGIWHESVVAVWGYGKNVRQSLETVIFITVATELRRWNWSFSPRLNRRSVPYITHCWHTYISCKI